MAAITQHISFGVMGTTRDEVVNKLDDLGSLFLDHIGGMPWEMPDDDTRRAKVTNTVADDQGYAYFGVRTYSFQGPFVGDISLPTHPGAHPQKEAGDDSPL